MATALTADAMLAALKKWGITPRFYRDDWRTHNRNAAQGFGPINGFVIHNFGSDASDPNSLAYLSRGDLARGMPGPLSQFAITDDGTVWVIGWGTANHTGSMSRALHALVLKDAAPLGADYRPGVRAGDAGSMSGVNDNYLGVEMTYGKAPTPAQRKSVTLLAAALMDALGSGYTGGSVIGHRECTVDRSDPVGVPMWQLRRDINALLKTGTAGTTPAPAAPEQDDIMAMTPSERAQLVKEIAQATANEVLWAPTFPGQKGLGGSSVRNNVGMGAAYAQQTLAVVRALAAKSGVDIDEQAIADAVVAGLAPTVRQAVIDSGQSAAVADAVVAKLGAALNPPAA